MSAHVREKIYQSNEMPPANFLAKTAGGTNPYFTTGAGGMLQSVIFAFQGLEITDKGSKQLTTQLPKKWHSLTITGVGKNEKTYRRK